MTLQKSAPGVGRDRRERVPGGAGQICTSTLLVGVHPGEHKSFYGRV